MVPAAHTDADNNFGHEAIVSLRREIEFRAEVNRQRIEALDRQLTLLMDSDKQSAEASRSALQAQLDGIRREIAMLLEASKEATRKQETAVERRFESVNEWRAQSADRERTMREQTLSLTSSFVPRELSDSQIGTLRADLDAIRTRMNVVAGQEQGREKQVNTTRLDAAQMLQVALVLAAIAAVVVNLLLHAH